MAGWTAGLEGWLLVAAWAVFMVVVVWLLIHDPGRRRQADPKAILRNRFARGEISEDELRRALAAVDADPPASASMAGRHQPIPHSQPGQEARHD